MQYRFTQNAVKDLRGFEVGIQKRIIEKLDFYMNANNPLEFARPLQDRKFGDYRFRIGEYRVIFDVSANNEIIILAIGHRREIYRRTTFRNLTNCIRNAKLISVQQNLNIGIICEGK